jgi:hypothetical protein
METKGKIIIFIFLINFITNSIADIIIKSPNQLAEKFKGKIY